MQFVIQVIESRAGGMVSVKAISDDGSVLLISGPDQEWNNGDTITIDHEQAKQLPLPKIDQKATASKSVAPAASAPAVSTPVVPIGSSPSK